MTERQDIGRFKIGWVTQLSPRSQLSQHFHEFTPESQSSFTFSTSTNLAMSAELLRPPAHLSQPDALRLSQQAPTILRQQAPWPLPWPFSHLVSNDSPEKWAVHENLFFSCLRTGDSASASACLERMKERFGVDNERVMGLTGIYHEATAPDQKTLENILRQYEDAIKEKPTNMIIRKRHVALLKSLGRTENAVSGLVDLLDASPVDAEAWSELAELYYIQGLYPQAIFSMEEVLLVMPNAWNVHARLGEILYVSAANTKDDPSRLKSLIQAQKSFCRSVELCDDYLRGYYGLKLTTSKVLTMPNNVASIADEDVQPPTTAVVQRLNELATLKLEIIIRKASTKMAGWEGYEESEIIAARELLNREFVFLSQEIYEN